MKTFSFMGKMFTLLTAMALCFGFAACSSDDDGNGGGGGGTGNFNAPEFEAEAAKYEIQSASSPYSSIELTASGNYIIQKNSGYAPAPSFAKPNGTKRTTMLKGTRATRSSEYALVLYGKYTKLADGQYALEGFGTIEISFNSSNNAYSLAVTPTGGTTETVTASKTHVKADGGLTNSLCRTWKFVNFRIIEKINGRTIYDITYRTPEEYCQKAYDATGDEEWLEELEYYREHPSEWEMPEEVVFTKSGTYIVKYANDYLAVSFWRWYDPDRGILQYSWQDDFEDEDESGTVTIEFSSNQCVAKESYSEVEDGVRYEEIAYSYMEEVR